MTPAPALRARADRRLRRLRRAELPVDTVELARYLIGKVVVHDTDSGRLSGRIVETEAYPVGDAAGHAFRGKTQRNRSLFLQRGHAYVYLCYGTSFLLNVTSEMAEVGAGVLLRAIEPMHGVDDMMAGLSGTTRLADLGHDGVDLCDGGALWLATTARRADRIGNSVRIGITRNADRRLRFYETGNSNVNGAKKMRH